MASFAGGCRTERLPSLQDIVDALADDIGRPVSVEDHRFRLLAYSAQDATADPVRLASILQRQTAPEVAAWLRTLDLDRAAGLTRVPVNEALGMQARTCAPLRTGGRVHGYLWVLEGAGPLGAHEQEAVVGAARRLAEIVGEERLVADALASTRRDWLRRIAVAADTDAAEQLQASMGWPPSDGFAALLARFPAGRTGDALARLLHEPDVVAVDHGADVLLLVRVTHARRPATVGQALRRAGAELVAIGGTAELAGFPRSLEEAGHAMLVARADERIGPVVEHARLGADAVVADLWTRAGRPPAPEPVARLERERRGPELCRALEALLEHGMDVSAAATALHVHRATLYRWIGRVEAATGLDLSRGDDRLLLHLALKVRRLSHAAAEGRNTKA